MADETYEVQARITVDKAGAQAQMQGVAQGAARLSGAASSAGSAISRAVSAAVGFAGAYVGVRAVSAAFQGLVAGSFQFASSMELTRTSLGAILAATQPALTAIADTNARLNEAGATGDAIFRQLQDDAVKSVATGAELAAIYSGIAGPLFGAGAALSDVRKITNDTVAAATALGVDFQQAQRDIMQMATGAAGTDVKLFRMLKSVNAITETTQEWNALLPEQRLTKLGDALATFAPSADRFGKTLPGAVSTFTDILQQFRTSFAGPTLSRFTGFLGRMNDMLIENKDQLVAFFGVIGTRVANVFGAMFDRIESVSQYLIRNMELILDSIGGRIDSMRETLGPLFESLSVGRVAGGIAAAKGVALFGGPGAIVSAITELGSKIGIGQGRNAVGQFTQNRVAGFGGGLAIMGVVAGTVSFMTDVWDSLAKAFDAFLPMLGFAWQGISQLAEGLGAFLWPALKLVGAVVTGVIVAAFMALSATLALFSPVFSALGELFKWAGEQLTISLNWITDGFRKLIDDIVAGLKILGLTDGMPGGARKTAETKSAQPGFFDQFILDMRAAMSKSAEQREADKDRLARTEGTPSARKVTVNDMRGSTINVKQDFRQADPDRVWLQLIEGISDAAEKRVVSALVPDFTR